MPTLNGADVHVRAHVQGAQLQLTVQDSGPGLAPNPVDGTGLSNTRERLVQAFGSAASLALENAPGGGCIARLHCPLYTPTAPPRT